MQAPLVLVLRLGVIAARTEPVIVSVNHVAIISPPVNSVPYTMLAFAVRHSPQIRLENTQEMQLLCKCCRQPYYPNKSFRDKLEALILGAERYAICPLCTQAPPRHIFDSKAYRRRCHYEVQRLQSLYEAAKKKR
jgi:hypothetical protein